MTLRNIFVLFSLIIVSGSLFSQQTAPQSNFLYGTSYVGNVGGVQSMNTVYPSSNYGIVNVMLTNLVEVNSSTIDCNILIETVNGGLYTLIGQVYAKANTGNPTLGYFLQVGKPNASPVVVASQLISIPGYTPLLLSNAAGATAPSGGALFNGLIVVKVGQALTVSAGANVSGNNGAMSSDFFSYTASIPTITTNTQTSFTNTQVNGWGGVATSTGTVTAVGIVYHTSATVNSGATSASTPTGTRLNITYPGSGVAFSANTTGLSPNTTYYYRAYVLASGSYYQGLVKSFTTCGTLGTVTPPASLIACNGDSKDFSVSGHSGDLQWELSSTSNGTFSNSPRPTRIQTPLIPGR